MGVVKDQIEARLGELRDTPWPDRERLAAWAEGAGEDLDAAWAACSRADDLLALGLTRGRSSAPVLTVVASEVRRALGLARKRDPRVIRVAFAAEQGGAKGGRMKLLDDARHLLADAERDNLALAKLAPGPEAAARRAAMEVERASAFLALAVVGDDAGRFANLAHAVRQVAIAFAALRVASGAEVEDAEVGAELARLAPEVRAALERA